MESQRGKILLVDDEPNTLKVLSAILKRGGYDVYTAKSAEEALEMVALVTVDSVVTDYKLPGMNGVEFLEVLKKRGSRIPVVMLTAFGTIEKAVDAMRRGAVSYLTKPVNPHELLTLTREAVEKHRLLIENMELKSQLRERYRFRNIIGKSRPMQDVFTLIETIAKSTSSVLITGESGTGKELVARALHYESPRAEGPFVPIDCATLPAEILESELFGHEKGAFTGAHDRKIGQIELANGGTLFLDEIGEISPAVQKKFLRFLQEREVMRVGGNSRIKVDARIIAATNRDLESEVRKGNFREDLFYRIHVVTIAIPPLRERKDDIPLLAAHFLSTFSLANNKVGASLDSEAIEALMEYDWPGNVRELENAIERAVVLCPTETIDIGYLPRAMRDMPSAGAEKVRDLNLLETERLLILRSLERTSWNQTKAAEILGISRKQLRTKMKHHGFLSEEADDMKEGIS
jgi:DNA-binding NtrC family response regulator